MAQITKMSHLSVTAVFSMDEWQTLKDALALASKMRETGMLMGNPQPVDKAGVLLNSITPTPPPNPNPLYRKTQK